MKAAFLGTPSSAVPSLAALGNIVEVDLVVTRPDAAAGRSRRARPPPIKVAAREWGLDVVQPSTARELEAVLADRKVDLAVVVAYGRLLSRATLETTRFGFVNVHFSLLPRWRGAAPVERAILEGDEVTGVSLMQLDEGLDTGPVISMTETDIGPAETAGRLTERLSFLGAALLDGTLGEFLSGSRRPAPQFEAGASHAPRLTTAEAAIESGEATATAMRKVRAYNPRPGAWIDLGGSRLKLWAVSAGTEEVPEGTISSPEGSPLLGLSDGSVALDVVQGEGKRRMSGQEWWRGLQHGPGPVPLSQLGR